MTPTEHEIVVFFSIVLGLLGAILIVIQIYQSLKRQPPLEQTFASTVRVDELENDMTRRIDKLEVQLASSFGAIDHKLDDHNKQAERRSSLLHTRINNISTAVSSLAGRCSAMHRGQHTEPLKIEATPEEVTG